MDTVEAFRSAGKTIGHLYLLWIDQIAFKIIQIKARIARLLYDFL
jgi:hypothetical protein